MKFVRITSLALLVAVVLSQTPAELAEVPESKCKEEVPNSKQCMFCKKADTYSSFLYSASYCKDTDECLLDQWNYKSKWCPSGWVRGWQLDLDCDCGAIDGGVGTCRDYNPSMEEEATWTNETIVLSAGEKCTFNVNASDIVAHALFENEFDDEQDVGILLNGYSIGEIIEVNYRSSLEITVYNGLPSSTATVEVAFSSADFVKASSFSMALILSMLSSI